MDANENLDVPRPRAVLKNAILSVYPVVFASKFGASWPVVFLDGSAGRGDYGDGTPGPPVRLTRSTSRFGSPRDIRGIYVEHDAEDFGHLREGVARYGRPADRVVYGDVSDHLPAILKSAAGSALFAVLDPFATALARDQFIGSLLGRGGRAPVEVLLHIEVGAAARLGGLLRSQLAGDELTEQQAQSIEDANRFLGGIWWQQHFLPVAEPVDDADGAHEQAMAAALRVARRYQQGIGLQTGLRAVSLPIRRQPDQLPTHVLVLITRHRDGLWQFADALGRAGLEWQRAWHIDADYSRLAAAKRQHPEPGLFDLESVLPTRPFDPEAYLAQNGPGWQRIIAENIERLLGGAGSQPLVLADRVDQVYGTVLAAASDRHVRAAVNALHAAGRIDHDGRGRSYHKDPIRLRRASKPEPAAQSPQQDRNSHRSGVTASRR